MNRHQQEFKGQGKSGTAADSDAPAPQREGRRGETNEEDTEGGRMTEIIPLSFANRVLVFCPEAPKLHR